MSILKTLEHGFKAAVIGLLQGMLKRGDPEPAPLDGNTIKRVLFLRPEKIGDMVISLPVFDALKKRFPHIEIAMLGSPGNYPLICDDPRFDRLFVYTKRFPGDLLMLRELRRSKFDCIFDMIDDDSATTLIISQLATPGAVRIGIGKRKHARFYDFNHAHASVNGVDGVGGHIIENTLKLLEPLGIEVGKAECYASPFIPERVQARTDRYLAQSASKGTGPVVGINISAGKPNRIWSLDKNAELVRQLLVLPGDLQLIIIAAPSDRTRGEELLTHVPDSVRLVPPGLGLIDVSSLISRLDLLVSPDTSLIHIARAFKVPVVGLYSRAPKNFERWRPFDQPDGPVVGKNLDDIFDITVNQVRSRVVTVLKREKQLTL